jgi:septal ring factor EnvC (AmiA/AmiB activator)
MRRLTTPTALALLLVLALLLLGGCAGKDQSNIPDDPRLVYKELYEIDVDIANTEEILKGSKAQQQIDDSAELREEIRRLEMELYELRAQRMALQERLDELEAEGKVMERQETE